MDQGLAKMLKRLSKTMNFEAALSKVVSRVAGGEGPGLMVLYGPDGAEKTTFLNCMEHLQSAASVLEAPVPEQVSELLSKLDRASYQCVSIDAKAQTPPLSRLDVALPLAIANQVGKGGLSKGNHVLVLCDDVDHFFRHDRETTERNERYLRDLAKTLDKRKTMTFLGTATLSGHWDPNVLGSWRVVNLGWD